MLRKGSNCSLVLQNELMFGVGFHTLFIGDGDSRTFKREEVSLEQ